MSAWPVGEPCLVCDRPCESVWDFERWDDGYQAIHIRCVDWLEGSSADPRAALRRILAVKVMERTMGKNAGSIPIAWLR